MRLPHLWLIPHSTTRPADRLGADPLECGPPPRSGLVRTTTHIRGDFKIARFAGICFIFLLNMVLATHINYPTHQIPKTKHLIWGVLPNFGILEPVCLDPLGDKQRGPVAGFGLQRNRTMFGLINASFVLRNHVSGRLWCDARIHN